MPVFKTGAINHSATSPASTVLLHSATSPGSFAGQCWLKTLRGFLVRRVRRVGIGEFGVRAIVRLEGNLCFPTSHSLSQFTGYRKTVNYWPVYPVALATTVSHDYRPMLRECNYMTHSSDRLGRGWREILHPIDQAVHKIVRPGLNWPFTAALSSSPGARLALVRISLGSHVR